MMPGGTSFLRRFAVPLLLAACWAGSGAAGDPPAGWLKTDGHAEAWVKKTARCRELLGKLKLDDPLVKKHLPNVKAKAELLARTASFDWKRQTAIDFLENMLTDLLAGAEPNRRYAGKGVGFPYWSETVNRVEAIWVHVPPNYDLGKRYQLFMYYKCGGGIHYKDGKAHGGYRPTVEVANQTETFHAWSSLSIQVKGRMGAEYELSEAVPALARDFSIDPDRVFLTGWSDGGFTALWLASRHPHLVAGIAPNCANWQYSNVNRIGLCNVPMLAVDGWGDGGYNRSQFVRWQTLHELGCDVAGLWGQHGHSYQPYEDIAEFKMILDWARQRRRNLHPRRVRFATWNLSWHRSFWVSIERMVDPVLPAQIDARVAGGNRVEVRTWNVGVYKLSLSDKLVDPAKPVKVATNGAESYAGPFRKDLLIELAEPPGGKFVKGAAMPGGITTQIERSTYGLRRGGGLKVAARPWMWVRPTGGDEKTRGLLSKWWPEWAKADTELTDADVARRNLFLFGGPELNKFTARIAADLPVKFAPGRFTVGRRVYDRPTHCVKFIHPNPLNPEKYVIVYAFNDAAAFAGNGFFGTRSESAWGFRSGDCVVMGVPGRDRRWGVAVRSKAFEQEHYVFDAGWRPAEGEPVGELRAPFDCTQMLRLRADAIRQATGADVGVVWSYRPGYLRWRGSLPAGDVALHDLATCEALPAYVMLADVKGDALAGMLSRAPATTLVADKRDPAYDPRTSPTPSEIDPKRTYRLAMTPWSVPAYGAEPRRMPKLFAFKTPKEFLAGKHVSLTLGNLRQLPLSVSEAVARHIRKRGKVSPRPVCFDLAQYIMNPQANAFGACDWLHLGAEVRWDRPGKAGPLHRRYTLSLGLRAAADPALAPPRENAKVFREANLADPAGPVAFNFAALHKKLPVAVTSTAAEFAIVADQAGKSFRLAAKGAEGVVGLATLLDLRLVNSGSKDVAGVAVLAMTAMQRINPSPWPSTRGRDKAAPKPYYAGYHHAVAPRGQPPLHEDAALFLAAGAPPAVGRLTANGVGYNFGLVGLRRPVAVNAGATTSVPLLLVIAYRPFSLGNVLDALKDGLIKKMAPD